MITVKDTPIYADVSEILDKLYEETGYLTDRRYMDTDVMVTCPKHKQGKERKPSCGIAIKEKRQDKKVFPAGTVHCFTCGYRDTLEGLVSTCLGYYDSGYKGYKWIINNFASVEIEERSLDINIDRKRKNDVKYISESELEEYRLFHPYMYERKLSNEVIEKFDVGFDEESNSLTFPVRDKNGKVVGIQRRSVQGKKFQNPEQFKKVLYGLYEIYQLKQFPSTIWLTEGIIDTLTIWSKGQASLAFMGLPKNSHLEQLNKLPTKKFIIATDNDESGKKAKEQIKKKLNRCFLYEAVYPKGVKDVNELTEEQFSKLKIRIMT